MEFKFYSMASYFEAKSLDIGKIINLRQKL